MNTENLIIEVNSKAGSSKPTHVRYFMLLLVCVLTAVNYLDRANLAVAAPLIQKELNLSPIYMGFVFSAFAWTYAAMQIPCGFSLDRLGNRFTYSIALCGWSLATCFISLCRNVTTLICTRCAIGLFEAPSIPINSRIVTTWFPRRERGLAIGYYTGAEYVGLAFCTPLLTWLLVRFGWHSIFYATGGLGLALAIIWAVLYRDPKKSGRVNASELKLIRDGDGLADMAEVRNKFHLNQLIEFFRHRQFLGLYVGQFSVSCTTWFFLTWFPSYLVTGRHLAIAKLGFYGSIPFVGAIFGVLVGGKWSDWMISKGYSIAISRKLPVVIGFLLSSLIIGANYGSSMNVVIGFMTAAIFGQAIASTVSWALFSELAPKDLMGIGGGALNFCSNLASIITPIVIGIIFSSTHSFAAALVFVGAVAMCGALAYIFVIGPVYRIEFNK
jgi:ACS family D-galactonate transporter-like MFS transporter